MLVLNTTSPPVSPGAPAASPSYQMPFSSARVAFIPVLLILQGPGDARDRAGDDARRRAPRLLAFHLDSHDVRADRHARHAQRRLTDAAAVDQHRGAARTRVDVDAAGERLAGAARRRD